VTKPTSIKEKQLSSNNDSNYLPSLFPDNKETMVVPPKRTRRLKTGEKLRSADKVERIPVKIIPDTRDNPQTGMDANKTICFTLKYKK
jgi:hypothetical protein